ncbi:hypothetical protein [Nocardia sp. NPDC003963]
MIPFEVNPGELPAIGAGVRAQVSSLATLLESVAPYATPAPSVECAPGFYMTAGFGVVDFIMSTYLATGLVESNLGGDCLVPASVTFETSDTAGGAEVDTVGGAVGAFVFGK